MICLGSIEEAVTYLQDHVADLILLDMIMAPSIDGLETYKRILEINPREKAIISSSQVMSDRIKVAQDLGAGSNVKKPFFLEKIGLAIRAELDR